MANERDERTQTTCLLIIAAVAIATALHWMQAVMIPFIIAVFIAILLTPLVAVLRRRLKLPHAAAVLLTLAIFIVVFVLLGSLISGAVTGMVGEFLGPRAASAEGPIDTEATTGGAYYEQIRDLQEKLIREPMEYFHLDPNAVDYRTIFPASTVKNTVIGLTNVVVDIASKSILIFIFVFFLLIGARPRSAPAKGFWGDVEKKIKKFLMAKFWLSLLTGVLTWLFLFLFKVDFAIVFGVFAFLLNFIPNIGSIVAVLLPIPVVLLDPDLAGHTGMQTVAVALPGAVQFSVGNLLEPKIMGKSLDLHPVTTLLALIFWGVLWGIMGMFLAIPITAIIKIFLERLELTRPIAALMAGRMDQSGLEL